MGQSLNPQTILNVVVKIRRLVKEHRPDIVYCHSSMAGGMGRLACLGLPVKIVYNPHGWAFNMQSSNDFMGKLKSRLFLWIEKALARCTDKIVCISEAERLSALNHKITSDDKLNVILNGINIQTIEKETPFSREEFGIPKEAYLIGMVGRISPQKAPDTFIKAAKLIKERIPEAWFIIVGDGEQRAEIETYAKVNNLGLYITGWTDKPYAYMKMFDLAMLLSRWEGFGLAIAEYMVAKKNFIATRVDAISTIVKDKEEGALVDVDSPKQVADAAWRIYSNKEWAMNMRVKAYETVYKKYDIHRVAKQHIELFNELVRNKSMK